MHYTEEEFHFDHRWRDLRTGPHRGMTSSRSTHSSGDLVVRGRHLFFLSTILGLQDQTELMHLVHTPCVAHPQYLLGRFLKLKTNEDTKGMHCVEKIMHLYFNTHKRSVYKHGKARSTETQETKYKRNYNHKQN